MSKALRVLHISKFYYPQEGGIEYFLKHLDEELIERNLQVMVLSHHKKPFWGLLKENIGQVLVWRLPIVANISYAPICLSFLFYLRQVIREFRPHLIHVHMPNVSPFFLTLIDVGLPICIHWHADVVGLDWLYRFYRIFEKRLLERAKTIIVTSREYLQSSQPLQKVKQKCKIVPLGIKTTGLKVQQPPPLPILQWLGKDRYILSVGRLTYYKGYEYLVEAFQHLSGIKLIIIGEGQKRVILEGLVKKLNLENKVMLTGYLPDEIKNFLLQRCLAFCLPSYERTEAFGLSLLEAMYYKKPIITSKIKGSGVNFVNQDGVTGLVVEPKNSLALARAIQKILHSPEQALVWGEQARKRFDQHFQIELIANQIIQVYEDTYYCTSQR